LIFLSDCVSKDLDFVKECDQSKDDLEPKMMGSELSLLLDLDDVLEEDLDLLSPSQISLEQAWSPNLRTVKDHSFDDRV
jgi:hypothetical protein